MRAASRIFSRDGFAASRIDEIAADAGYTRGAFYAHFKSKEDLFFALLEEQLNLHMTKIRAALEKQSDERARLSTMREYYLSRSADRQWSILVFEFKLYAFRNSNLRAKLAESHRRIRTKIKQEILGQIWPSSCETAQADIEQNRVALEALLHGLVLQQAYDPTSISTKQMRIILGKLFDVLIQPTDS